MTSTLRHALCLLLGTCCLIVAACGGGGEVEVTAGDGKPGTLSIIISGLPAGTPANVTVTGPGGYRQTVGQSTTLGNLQAGTYTVTAASVTKGSVSFRAQQPVQTMMVAAGTAPVAGVVYGSSEVTPMALDQMADGLVMQ
ncbi:hypothetical protein AB4156_05850 [Cupriavidus sp. 2MCAB6]|uniref:hypothetical protein n=1 Tax=Cupriavidus sp. 2MCAB6 TaxID=3232981 RepID=UPI003F90C39A